MSENIETMRKSVEAWNRGDVETYIESFHPECEWFSAIASIVEGQAAGVWRGREDLRRFWDEWHSLWNLTIDISETRELDNTIVSIGQMRAHGKASGVEVDSPVAYVADFDGGLIRRLHAYLNPDEALAAVGLSEQDADTDS